MILAPAATPTPVRAPLGKTKKASSSKSKRTPNKKGKESTPTKKVKKVATKCFVASCTRGQKAKSKWCTTHAADIAAMKTQAEKAEEMSAYNKMITCPDKADAACEEFDRLNPEGRFRKALIE